jgi:hypothetical protein
LPTRLANVLKSDEIIQLDIDGGFRESLDKMDRKCKLQTSASIELGRFGTRSAISSLANGSLLILQKEAATIQDTNMTIYSS